MSYSTNNAKDGFTPPNRDEVWQMLLYIPANDRGEWIKTGMAIKDYSGNDGYSLWIDWSQNADNYDPKTARSSWRSFKGGGITILSLIQLARQHGWRPDAKPCANKPPKPRPAPAKTTHSTGAYALRLCLAASTDDVTVAGHPYAIAKGINWAAGAARGIASGFIVGKDTDCIIVPIRNLITNKVQGVQCISDKPVDGEWPKQNFGSVSGGALILGNTLDKSIPWYVCEGWASTVSTVFHHLHGNGVCACSFGKSMQRPVAEVIAEHYEPKEVIILEEEDDS
jgi:hypothetical protein